MTTILTIILAVLIVLNIWLGAYTAKREKARRKLLQERMDEFDETIGELTNNLGRAKERVGEVQSLLAAMKKDYENLLVEHEDLKLSYNRVVLERDDVKGKYGALLRKRDELLAEIERHKENPVAGGEPGKPLPGFKVDFDELRKSYEELAKSYDVVAQEWENPSKTYLVNHIIKAYKVKNQTALAKALGVSKSAISRMIKK